MNKSFRVNCIEEFNTQKLEGFPGTECVVSQYMFTCLIILVNEAKFDIGLNMNHY